MHTDLMLQAIHAAEIDQKRLHDRLMDEQLRIARTTQPRITTRLAQTIGLMLIAAGERLQHGSATVGQGTASISRAA